MSDLVQAILLPPDAKKHSESQVVRAVATASAHAYLARSFTGSASDNQRWRSWLSGPFTKSVRVAKSHADFALALREAAAVSKVEDFTALAFAPMAYEEMPRHLTRARVSGLRCEDDLPREPGESDAWSLAVVAEMSTGKLAAQAAHALMAIAREVGHIPVFTVYRADVVDLEPEKGIQIIDKGLTEFGEPTLTVVATRVSIAPREDGLSGRRDIPDFSHSYYPYEQD